MRVPPEGGVPERLAERYLGERVSVSEDRVYFDQREYVASVAVKSDLYALDPGSLRVQRLTRGARVSDPDISPDGRWLVAIAQRGGSAALVRLEVQPGAASVTLGEPSTLVEEPETQFGAPRWSPDGARIAVERRRLGLLPQIVIVDAETRAVRLRVVADEGRVGEPEWVDDHRLLLSWERPRASSVLCSVNLLTGAATVVAAPLHGARAPALSPDGRRIAFVGYTPDGYDVFTATAGTSGDAAGLRVERDDEPAPAWSTPVLTPSPYSVASMVPRFWMPVVVSDEERLEFGAATAGLDVLGRHAYAADVRWSDRSRPDWDAAYTYDRWRPSLFIAASDDTTVWQDEDYRETSVDAGFSLPFRTVRRRQQLFGAFHVTREQDPRASFDRRSARVAYQIATARSYGYSISPEDGIVAGAALDVTRRAFGADADAVTLSVDLRAYPRLGGRHRVLAVRTAAAASYGDRAGRRVLGAGGSAASGSPIAFGRDAVGLVRGFDSDEVVGSRAAVLNVDYRVPLVIIERGLGRLPVFVRQLHAAAYVDIGHAWTGEFRAADLRRSAGLELSSDLVLGHYAPVTVASGVAFRDDPAGLQSGATAFLRVGTAF
jgi:Tol biopolymer transport system component